MLSIENYEPERERAAIPIHLIKILKLVKPAQLGTRKSFVEWLQEEDISVLLVNISLFSVKLCDDCSIKLCNKDSGENFVFNGFFIFKVVWARVDIPSQNLTKQSARTNISHQIENFQLKLDKTTLNH